MSSPEVPIRSPEWYADNPHARMSFSRLATYKRCPAWFRFQYLDWHRSWNTPTLRAGHVVQGVLERVFDGVPADDVSMDELLDRASARARAIFDLAWKEEQRIHEEAPNGYGPWDLDGEQYAGYVHQGLKFHVAEVRARMEGRHPRTGDDLAFPQLDSPKQAWEAVRPWHAPQTDDFQEAMEHIPSGFLQGQYDLVYTWTGGRRIVDLKASTGESAFSPEISDQLRSYAYMERELGRGLPEGLEAWFLGKEEPLLFPLPSDEELEAFEAEVLDLIHLSGSERAYGEWDAQDFPESPAQVPGQEPRAGEPSAWCRYCPATHSCESSATLKAPREGAQHHQEPDPSAPATFRGLVIGIGESRTRSNGRTTRRFTLANESGALSLTWNEGTLQRLFSQGLKAGAMVVLEGLNPWKHPASGNVIWYDTQQTSLEVLNQSQEAGM